ncbi:uncharacterized protein AB675_7283 [Cyphellophora attinorum]|uniref:Uncharacterized protein n=1 Tax=Cyphellophora attinorum TaxID=1664694 RepID=A0A0N1H4P5_9EURO|nr:uncharacterized protein AB675_7283 [Phialophora attinorum]KPI36363.1 hypothetical protein AB675_7283 [Phialophora attinorum]
MATSTSDTASHLPGLPSEVLQMIFKEVFKGLHLDCKYSPVSSITRITYPSSIIVSKQYLAEAMAAVLQEATIDLGRQKFNQARGLPYSFPGFQNVQHIKAPLWHHTLPGAALAAVKAAPRLLTLTLTLEYPFWLWHSSGSWKFASGSFGSNAAQLVLETKGVEVFKSKFQSFLSHKLQPFWRDIIREWSQRHEAFQICMAADLTAQTTDLKSFHLSTAIFSTRTGALALMPGKDNVNPVKDKPEFVVPLDPSFFRGLIGGYVN